jgi:hypothetical protein
LIPRITDEVDPMLKSFGGIRLKRIIAIGSGRDHQYYCIDGLDKKFLDPHPALGGSALAVIDPVLF